MSSPHSQHSSQVHPHQQALLHSQQQSIVSFQHQHQSQEIQIKSEPCENNSLSFMDFDHSSKLTGNFIHFKSDP